jgi:ribosome-binding protein aMBF1 (putative translation factor)
MRSKSRTADLETQIGERIRSRRIRAGVSQENLGKPPGITFQQVQKYPSPACRNILRQHLSSFS